MRHESGILVLDGDAAIRYASGAGNDPAIQQCVMEDLSEKRALGRGMVALNVPEKAIATFCTFGQEMVFLIQPVEQRSYLFDFVASVDFAETLLSQQLANPYSGMLVIDKDERVRFISPAHQDFFKLKPGEAIGKKVTDFIPQSNIPEVMKTGTPEYGGLFHSEGGTRVVSRVPVRKNGQLIGAFGQVMFNAPERLHSLSQEVGRLRKEVDFYRKEYCDSQHSKVVQFEHMIGESDALRQLKSDLLKVAPLHVPVLIVGESGTGKELAAQAIHALSQRSNNRMVVVNAAAIPANLVEAELFGYESGSFTGAEKGGRRGKFELANNSSIFFDEMGDLPPEIQVKLLRVLQDGSFERVGAQKMTHSDFRLISASNRNFEDMVAKSEFRLDLYYRISGVTVRMPSLRERLDDIPLLVENFLVNFARRHNSSVKRVDARVYDYLREYSWPGNVRQLRHEVEKAAIFCDAAEISIDSFRLLDHAPRQHVMAPVPLLQGLPEPELQEGEPAAEPLLAAFAAADGGGQRIQDAVHVLEQQMIHSAMQRLNGNKKKVAHELGISRAYLYKKLSLK